MLCGVTSRVNIGSNTVFPIYATSRWAAKLCLWYILPLLRTRYSSIFYWNQKKHNNLTTIHGCLASIANLMSQNLLHLSSAKSEVLVISPDNFSKEVRHFILPLTSNIKTRKNWYTIQQFNFKSHITTTSTTHLNVTHTSFSLSQFSSLHLHCCRLTCSC